MSWKCYDKLLNFSSIDTSSEYNISSKYIPYKSKVQKREQARKIESMNMKTLINELVHKVKTLYCGHHLFSKMMSAIEGCLI